MPVILRSCSRIRHEYFCRIRDFSPRSNYRNRNWIVREMSDPGENLVTTYVCKGGREYVVKMRVTDQRAGSSRRNLDLTVTDKYTAEDWQSSYDTAYIENLTHKTGNYKQFDVFVAMLQSGLLKTSDCVTLDLLTFEDLELLRSRRTESGSCCSASGSKTSNRRYLIVTYSVEFDRIHYPLPLEHCGSPQPAVLQATIRKLEAELERLRSAGGGSRDLHKKLEQLTVANKKLVEENRRLQNGGRGVRRLLGAVRTLESTVAEERASFRAKIQKLRAENAVLSTRLRQSNESVNVRPVSRPTTPLFQSRRSVGRRGRSRSATRRTGSKLPSLSPGSSSVDSLKSGDSSRREIMRHRRFGAREIDFGNLESRVHALQKMLKDGINLN